MPPSEEQTAALRRHVADAIADELARADIDWSCLDALTQPSVRIEVEFHDRAVEGDSSSAAKRQLAPVGLTIRQVIDLTSVMSPKVPTTPSLAEGDAKAGAVAATVAPPPPPEPEPDQQKTDPSSGTVVPLSRTHTPLATRTSPRRRRASSSPSSHDRQSQPQPQPQQEQQQQQQQQLRQRGTTTVNEKSDDASDGGGVTSGASNASGGGGGGGGGERSSARMAISGLRPSRRGGAPVVEEDTQRQMEVVRGNFPKRRKAEAVGYAMRPSTLDKLIVGIWEQLHSGATMDPVEILNQFVAQPQPPTPPPPPPPPLIRDGPSPSPSSSSLDDGTGAAALSLSSLAGLGGGGGDVLPSSSLSSPWSGRQFSDTTVFCRRVTQASRTCRSVEVIVQARWVEHFDAYVEHLKASAAAAAAAVSSSSSSSSGKNNNQQTAGASGARYRKAALAEAAAGFGWAEKELRNKMAIWRGYREIKDAGGWAALVFAGMGVYRFCKYRIGFDADSMQRLRALRPAIEVAADTMSPNWRRLLALVGASPERLYAGHPHDWVVCLDGSPPVALRTTYLHLDPRFEFRHIEESVIDQAAWGGDDPRWVPPSSSSSSPGGALARVSSSSSSSAGGGAYVYVCQTCAGEQSDDARVNACYCFPSLFGCATPAPPPPVQIFRTADGRNNGLRALCAFERGAAVGEFVGVVTRGLQDVDVMENTTGSARYQIWQGTQGNFTRFVNHSCNANSQYQRFTWLDTQRIVLVSKGVDAGAEITVDYSDKYWKGLDKKCLCGEKSCRYRKNR